MLRTCPREHLRLSLSERVYRIAHEASRISDGGKIGTVGSTVADSYIPGAIHRDASHPAIDISRATWTQGALLENRRHSAGIAHFVPARAHLTGSSVSHDGMIEQKRFVI